MISHSEEREHQEKLSFFFFQKKDGVGQEALFNVMKAYSIHDRQATSSIPFRIQCHESLFVFRICSRLPALKGQMSRIMK